MNSDQLSTDSFLTAQTNGGVTFEIGGVRVEVVDPHCPGPAVSPSLWPFLTHARRPNISIEVEWVADLTLDNSRPVFDSGCTWQLFRQGSQFRFDFQVPALGPKPYKRLLIDRHFSQATLQMRQSVDRSDRRLTPLMYPLDELLIMHRLTQEKAIELHGCGIVRADGTGNLFVGHSGAGKSTTTRLWTERENVLVLSDDRIIVRRDKNRKKVRMYGTPWHGEAMYASPESAPLTRIFILDHGRGNVLTPLAPGEAVAELFARSFVPFHQHDYVESALTFLEEVAGVVPVYRYAFEPGPPAVDTILNLHD